MMNTLSFPASKRIMTGFGAVLGMALLGFEAIPAQAAPPKHAPAWGYRRKQQQQQQRNGNRNRSYTRSYNDLDGDGIPNSRDRDVDGDGTPNSRDRDIDGDGISNSRDRSDYSSARWRRSSTGTWVPVANTPRRRAVPAGYYRNRSGQVVRRTPLRKVVRVQRPVRRRVGDADRDGIRNKRDRDIDGDGVRNSRDRNRDGDKARNKRDRYPRNPRRR